MDAAVRMILALVALYLLVRGTWTLGRLWRREPTETRLLWLIVVLTGAVALLANVDALVAGRPLLSATYASALPLVLGVVIVSLPDRYRATKQT